MNQKLRNKQQQSPPGTITTTSQRVDMSWSGPLPPPGDLARYNEVTPGLADRIVSMAENEAIHRHDQERRQLAGDMVANRAILVERRIGQVLAFVVALLVCGTGGFLVYAGHPVAGTVFGGAGLAPVVWAFVPKRSPGLQRNNQVKKA